MIPDHHPGYISMETFEANIAALAANRPVRRARAAVPRGTAGPGFRA